MSMNQELHVKYRPTTFDQVLGQDHIIGSLTEALSKGTTRAFLLHGDSGCGKTTLARIIASNVGAGDAVVQEFDAASYSGIEDIRKVCEPLRFSQGSRSRVMIMDECHSLSKKAWEVLLKIIEEPPPGVYWCFCTTEISKVPQPIKTRCTDYKIKSVDRDLLFDLLDNVCDKEGLETGEDILELICKHAGGSPREALTSLGKVAHCGTRKEAALLLDREVGTKSIIELAYKLANGAKFNIVMSTLQALELRDAESSRRTIMSYVGKALLSSKNEDKAAYLCTVLEGFAEPYPVNAGKEYLALSVGRALLG